MNTVLKQECIRYNNSINNFNCFCFGSLRSCNVGDKTLVIVDEADEVFFNRNYGTQKEVNTHPFCTLDRVVCLTGTLKLSDEQLGVLEEYLGFTFVVLTESTTTKFAFDDVCELSDASEKRDKLSQLLQKRLPVGNVLLYGADEDICLQAWK